MKKLLLFLLVLVVLGIGATLWASWVSEDELPDLLSGDYELISWELSSSGEQRDSIMLHQLPIKGEIIHLNRSAEGCVTLTTDIKSLRLDTYASYTWESVSKSRNGWFFPHCLFKQWYWAKNADNKYAGVSLTTYCDRSFYTEDYVSLSLSIIDPENEHLHWLLTFRKKIGRQGKF